MTRRPAAISPEVFDLLRMALVAVEVAHSETYAIGGAVAMAAHGYARQTADVDLFIAEQDRGAVLKALRQQGLRVVPVFEGIHYAAYVPLSDDEDLKIDVLIPHADPDWSAVVAPEQVEMGGLKFMAFPIELLVLSKYYAQLDGDPQDKADIDRMLHRGMFDPASTRRLLAHMDPEELDNWDKLIAEISRPRPTGRRPPRRSQP